jgi:hypothetical protein
MADQDRGGSSSTSGGRRGNKRPPSRSPVRSPQSRSRARDGRTPSPVSIGSVRYRPLSPVYDPDAKVYPPYVMKWPQIFVPAMNEDMLWGKPTEAHADEGEEQLWSSGMDWDSETSCPNSVREAPAATGREASSAPSQSEEEVVLHRFDPRQTGSFPPRPEELLVFPPPSLRHKRRCQLADLDVDEDQVRQPETDVQPSEGSMDGVRAIDATGNKGQRTKFVLPLELFDNPDIDLIHPSLLIQAVSPSSDSLNMTGSRNRNIE